MRLWIRRRKRDTRGPSPTRQQRLAYEAAQRLAYEASAIHGLVRVLYP